MCSKKLTNGEIIMAFNKLKTKPYVSSKDLTTSKPHMVLSMLRHKNKYGDVVIAELDDMMLYLPKRYNSLKDEVIEGTSNGQFTITRKLENGVYVLELDEEQKEEAGTTPEDIGNEDEDFYIPNAQPFFSWEMTKIPKKS